MLVNNPDPSRGPLSSLWAAMDAVPLDVVDGILMTPVDIPMTRPQTVRAVIDEWQRTRAAIVRPAVGARHGHPVLFDRSIFDELRRAPLNEGAKVVIRARTDRVVNVGVDDEGCLGDVDTPADYEAMLRVREAE
jgi:CTP:molybdopterin cytidylyltransferase MocA